jgi:hypothetical protein
MSARAIRVAAWPLLLIAAAVLAQNDAPDARARALIDLEGDWVSVVSEDWRWRLVTPAKGDYASVPLNAAGEQAADGWEPDADEGSCLPYGAPSVLRMPTRLRIRWADANTLRIETEAGAQTRVLAFSAPVAAAASRQGRSSARWDGSALEVQTSNLLPGFLRRNGVPYSGSAELTEYFNTHAAYGDDGFTVTTIVRDPVYLREEFVTSSTFLRLPEGSAWQPTPCVEPAES